MSRLDRSLSETTQPVHFSSLFEVPMTCTIRAKPAEHLRRSRNVMSSLGEAGLISP